MPTITPPTPEVRVQEGALVGDDALEVRNPEALVISEEVPAQVTAEPGEPVRTQPVHEVAVALDKVITDPSSPEAVQIPDAGRGDLSLPLHAVGEPSPEQTFAAEGSKKKS